MNSLALQLPRQAARRYHRVSTAQRTWRTAYRAGVLQQSRYRSTDDSPDERQAIPLTGYYAELLDNKDAKSARPEEAEKDILDKDILKNAPKEQVQPVTHTAPQEPPSTAAPKTQKEETLEKASVVFGSRLAGPAERKKEIDAKSRAVAGILVPPKPEEPDNCCMSGCVNCVWDVYRDDLEDWATKSAQAREQLQAQRSSGAATGTMLQEKGQPTHVATSMDDDGGGSEANWEADLNVPAKAGDLFGDIPVGIKEFMKTEKKLKQMHLQESQDGARP